MKQKFDYEHHLKSIENKECELQKLEISKVEKIFEMIQFLKKSLITLKQSVLKIGFINQLEEIDFFKNIKPQVLAKLIFYNKIYKIETNCPLDTRFKKKYYQKHVQALYLEYKQHFSQNDFYIYHNSCRNDKDVEYFTLGKTDTMVGSNSFIFEIDPQFSTYYDYKSSRIIAHDYLQNYLQDKITEITPTPFDQLSNVEKLTWSESQNALIELIYALYLSGSINNGKGEIRKIAAFFQQLFGVKLLDIHHAFHRMKTRAKSRTCYLDKLKQTLEEYMDK